MQGPGWFRGFGKIWGPSAGMWGHGAAVGATTTTTTITRTTSTSSFRAVVGGRVVGPEAVHLQLERALGVVPGDGEAPLHRRRVAWVTTIVVNTRDVFEPLPGCLSHPEHALAAEVEAGGLAEEGEGPPRWLEATVEVSGNC